jgi:hypothetical protein
MGSLGGVGWSKIAALALASVLFLANTGCSVPVPEGRTPPVPAPERPDPAVRDQIQIYSLVVRRLCGPDDTGGGEMPKPVVYISRVTNDRAGDFDADEGTPALIPDAVQTGVVAALADLQSKIEWVDRPESVRRVPSTGAVWGGGAIIELGSVRRVGENEVHVPASIYFANLGAGGTTYVVRRVGGTWRVTGTTGVQWIS